MKNFYLALFLISIGLTSTKANAQWASIAYSKSTGNEGHTNNWPDQHSAEEDAIHQCNAPDCLIIASHYDGCLALAVGDHIAHYGWAWNVNQTNAEQRSRLYCSQHDTNCVVKASVCSDP
jgi:hypothetical protein